MWYGWSNTITSVSRKRAQNVTVWCRMYKKRSWRLWRARVVTQYWNLNLILGDAYVKKVIWSKTWIKFLLWEIMNWMTAFWVAGMHVIAISDWYFVFSFFFHLKKNWGNDKAGINQVFWIFYIFVCFYLQFNPFLLKNIFAKLK